MNPKKPCINRKTFPYENQQITASGIIFYAIKNSKPLLFLRNKADFGGKCEAVDASPLATAAREAEEESNGFFSRQKLQETVSENVCVYVPNCKYLHHFHRIEFIENEVIKEQFGVEEVGQGQAHSCRWYDVGELVKLHIRMPSVKVILQKIQELEELRG